MKAKEVLQGLEQECEAKGVKLIFDDLQSEGGLCRLRNRYYIIINRRAAVETRVRIISDALSRIPAVPIQPEPAISEPGLQPQELESEVAVVRAGGSDTEVE